jgi:hypothetical protein
MHHGTISNYWVICLTVIIPSLQLL